MKFTKLTIYISILLLGLTLASSASAAITLRPALNLGLVGYWSFEEGTGTKAGDSSGNGNDGSLQGSTATPTWITGKRGSALSFDGGDRVSIADNANLNPLAAWTVSSWVKLNNTSGSQVVFARGASGESVATNANTEIVIVSGKARATYEYSGAGNNVYRESSTTLSPNIWYFVTGVYTGSALNIYINGSLDNGTLSGDPSQTPDSTSNTVRMGDFTDGGAEFLNGQLDEVRIYNRALSGTEISNLYQSGSAKFLMPDNKGLVGYWSMEEGTGDKAGDSSGNGNTGSITGASWTDGKRGKALSFNGTSDYVDADNVYDGVKTISFWMKADTLTNSVIDLNGTAKVEISDGTITTSGITSPTIYVDGAVSSTVDTNWHYVTIKTDTGINASAVKLGQVGDSWTCGDTLTDSRDSKTYATVLVGSQCWMKQGLNIGTRVNGGTAQGTTCTNAADVEKWCYNNLDANCDSNNNPNYPDGGLYKWAQAMCGSTTEGVQGICPSGWHLPTDAQMCTLEQSVDATITCDSTGPRGTDGGTKLKPGGSSGWEGNLAGDYGGGFFYRATIGIFWSSTQYDSSNAWGRNLPSGNATVTRNYLNKTTGFSVRCVKDSGGGGSASYFSGKLDEVRVYNRALSGTEITNLYNSSGKRAEINSSQTSRLTNGLVGMWSFDGPDVNMSTNTAYDRAGSNNGTITGATQAIGKVGQALSFDGTDDDVTIANLNGITYPFTYSAWFRSSADDSSPPSGTIVSQDYASSELVRAQLYFNGTSGFCFNVRSSVSEEAEPCTVTNLQDNNWHHAVGVSSASNDHRLYIDGVLISTSTNNVPTPSTVNRATIGDWPGGNGNTYDFNGLIDEVRIYDRALSAGEVEELYNMGKGPWQCGIDRLVDSRDGKKYATVAIGDQCWMKQGLNVGTRVNGGTAQGTTCASAADIEKWCYSNTDANCNTNNNPNYPDGGLYQWNQAMCGSTTPGVQGICPTGWHLPTDAEQYTLENYLKDGGQTCGANRVASWDCSTAGTKLKPNGTSGWEGNLAGYYNGFSNRATLGYFWSSTEYDSSRARDRFLDSGNATVYRGFDSKEFGFSVRCLKN